MNTEDDVNLFNKQASGGAAPQYSRPPISPDDEGDLAIALTADRRNNVVRIRFAKSVSWIAMEPKSARAFVGKIMEKIEALEEPTSKK